ncbi:MAG TPA: DUF389 domain-containing protein [Candidatus Peribacteraceae bacterium]|nr:DUF389 domain-containing protein [Candidatus Peribacteraceae bacterium]
MLFFPQRTSILEATAEERLEAIENLIRTSTIQGGYYLLLILAVLIVTPGLLVNNTAVIIGGMVMTPLLSPILLLAISLVSGSLKGIGHALLVIVFSLLLTLFLSALLARIFVQAGSGVEWIPQSISPNIYFFIAFCSGIAAAFAWVKKEIAPTIAGIAIAVSLLPPLCAVGVGLSYLDWQLAINSSALFVMNFAGILMAACFVFAVLGFLPARAIEEKALQKKGR